MVVDVIFTITGNGLELYGVAGFGVQNC